MIEFNHFNFNVLNLEKSIAFYKEAIGLSVVREKDSSDGSFKIVYLGCATEKSLITLEMKNSILHSRQMSMMLFIRNMKRWDAFATKILLWESILSMIQTDIGLKSFR